ncbi:protein kinase [Lentinula detonsa]|uniref:Protein kinase n=1 Tax=Lentinula detonsa TaxID=2804962 RepID=A0AA38UT14_9AGAR|nr:protein kinase [Lentinula detonsa]
MPRTKWDSHLARAIYYERSAIVESKLLNFNHQEDRLIFAKMIKRLCALPLEDLGFAPNLEADFIKNPASLLEAMKLPEQKDTTGPPSSEIFDLCQGSSFTFPYKDDQTRTVRLKRVIFCSNSIIGRGTTVIRVECACCNCPPARCDWKEKKLVLKMSFPSKTRVSERTFMDRCKELAQGEYAWVSNHLPDLIWSFDIPFRDGSPQANLGEKFKDYEMRVMRGVILEELKPLSSLKTARECAQVFYDIVQCHHWVWKYPRILHRDISQGNIMVREKNGKKYGVLNDWDLAIWLDDKRDGPTSQFRTGTKPYMAHEQHSVEWKGPHRYRHDLESIFYVMLLLVCLYSRPDEKLRRFKNQSHQYQEWHQSDDRSLYLEKHHTIRADNWEPPVTTFFFGFLLWLSRLQRSMRRGFYELGDAMQLVPKALHPEMNFFDEDTLGGHLSYEVIVSIVHVFEEEELETRGREWQLHLDNLRQKQVG